MPREMQNLYEIFNNYSKQEIDNMICRLMDEERNLLYLRYGNDLDNPVKNDSWTRKDSNRFYGTLVPKMKRLLLNPEEKSKKSTRRTKKSVNKIESTISNDKQLLTDVSDNSIKQQDNLVKEDYIKILQLMKTPNFGDMLKILTPKEAVVICLKLGYIDEKYFTTESIADFLGIEQNEVREIVKKVLMVYQKNINEFIDQAIEVATGNSKILNK